MFSKLFKFISNRFKKVGHRVDKLMFSTNYTCNLCKKEIFSGKYFCEDCENELMKNDECICETCGRQTPTSMSRCFSCKTEWSVDKARSAYVYDGGIKKLVMQYKYSYKKYLSEIFLEEMKTIYIKNAFFPDVITFVPMTKKRLFERGFNHSEHLARGLGAIFQVDVLETLFKKYETERQAGLSSEMRRKNLQKSFGVANKKAIKGKNILLVDDVLTTGSTAGEVSRLLKKRGANSVYLITVASTSIEI